MRLVTLKKNREFGAVYARGRSCSTKNMVLIYKRRKADAVRAGFSVSKKIGNSVARNRKRRQLKECFRICMDKIEPGVDIVFTARAPIAEAGFSEIERDMRYLLRKTSLLRDVGENAKAADGKAEELPGK